MACCGVLACIWGGSLALPSQPEQGKLSITMFSIGQGESTLITFPDGKRMLVDGGGSAREGGPDVGERLLAPALWRLGVKRIDFMVLTHPHPDHLQGLTFVAAHFRVGEFWEGGSSVESADYRNLKRILAEKQVPVRRLDSSVGPIAVGGAVIEPLAPFVRHSHKLSDEYADINEESLVFRLVSGRFAVLFTGDAGHVTEELLLARPELLLDRPVEAPMILVPAAGSQQRTFREFGKKLPHHFRPALGAMLLGNVVIYVVGLPWLKVVTGMSGGDAQGSKGPQQQQQRGPPRFL